MGLEVMTMGVQGGVALGWVFAVGGGIRVHVYRDGVDVDVVHPLRTEDGHPLEPRICWLHLIPFS